MSFISSFFSRESLAKKVANRNIRRMEEYTKVSTAMKEDVAQVYNDSRDSVARYAQKHNCNLEFEPNADDLNTTKMNVYKRNIHFYDPLDGTEPVPYMMPDRIGTSVIPNNITSSKDMVKTIKTEAAKILYNNI